MSIFQSIKRALGFDPEEDELSAEEFETVDYSGNRSGESDSPKIRIPEACVSTESISELKAEDAPESLFTEVLAIFNESLPPFIKDSIDREAQKKLIYDTLSESVRKYIEQLNASAKKNTAIQWAKDKNAMTEQIKEISAKLERAKESEQEAKKNQLSADRQKRAMTERLHDLETQVANLQAEHEQYELENKSLINKLRAASIHEEDNVSLREQVETLSEQVRKGQSPVLSPEEIAEIETLRAKAAELESLKEENARLLTDIETAKATIDMSKQMVNNQINLVAETKEQLKAKTEEAESLTAELSDAKKANETSEAEIASLKAELEEANTKVAEIYEIEKHIVRFEDIKKRKEAKINELQQEKEALAEELRVRESEILALKKSIERNLFDQAKNEREMRAEIAELRSLLPEKPAPTPDDMFMPEFKPKKQETAVAAQESEPAPKKKKQVKISAIDDSLDSTDWLVSTPPENLPASTTENEEPFGYVSPVKKNPPKNDAQMLLFD